MINPDDDLPIDDSEFDDAEDQQSQRDIHSNGLDDDYEGTIDDDIIDTDQLDQAYDASEPSYTLDEDDDE